VGYLGRRLGRYNQSVSGGVPVSGVEFLVQELERVRKEELAKWLI